MGRRSLSEAGRIVEVASADGTRVGCRVVGSGPPVVVVHGGMESSMDHGELALALAADFTVYLPDRRGRGLSAATTNDHPPVVPWEVADLSAVIEHSGAEHAFGISSGAIIVLQTARELSRLRAVAVMEPPLPVSGVWASGLTPEGFLVEYRNRLERGDPAGASAYGLAVTQMGPPWMYRAPQPLLKAAAALQLRLDRRRDGEQRRLIESLVEDTRLIIESQTDWEAFTATTASMLVIGGEQSPAYLQRSTERLRDLFPAARAVTIPGAGHGASGNRNRGGKPVEFAQALRDFFSSVAS